MEKTVTDFHFGSDLTDVQARTALTTPEHMIRWAEATGRQFLILNVRHLIEASKWPEGVEVIQQLVSNYRDHRRVIPSGLTEKITVNLNGGSISQDVPIMLGESLSLAEIDQVRLMLDRMAAELHAELSGKGVTLRG